MRAKEKGKRTTQKSETKPDKKDERNAADVVDKPESFPINNPQNGEIKADSLAENFGLDAHERGPDSSQRSLPTSVLTAEPLR